VPAASQRPNNFKDQRYPANSQCYVQVGISTHSDSNLLQSLVLYKNWLRITVIVDGAVLVQIES
jgi:hypothetical protein